MKITKKQVISRLKEYKVFLQVRKTCDDQIELTESILGKLKTMSCKELTFDEISFINGLFFDTRCPYMVNFNDDGFYVLMLDTKILV